MQDSFNHDSPVISQQVWRHAFGESTIEICADGTVLIDGKVVRDTLPTLRAVPAVPAAAGAPEQPAQPGRLA